MTMRSRKPAARRKRYEGPESSYRLAFTDTDFLLRDELRPVRLQLELLKPAARAGRAGRGGDHRHLRQRPHRRARSVPAAELESARAADDARGRSSGPRRVWRWRAYYEQARRFAAIVTERSASFEKPIFVVTGGEPGHHGSRQPRRASRWAARPSGSTSCCRTSRCPTASSRPSCAFSSTTSPFARCTS